MSFAAEQQIDTGGVTLNGELLLPPSASGLVVFAHGSGSSRHSPRNQAVARRLREAGLGTLLFDLLTAEEEQAEAYTRHLRFDISLLANRLVGVTRWLLQQRALQSLSFGYFGSSTGAAAALVAAAEMGPTIRAVVSRGGRPDLAGPALSRVQAATLLIVGGNDQPVIPLNEIALDDLQCKKALQIVPGASHLFEESGALEAVANWAADWFNNHLKSSVSAP
jgi:putative phosphoribosyl transferase